MDGFMAGWCVILGWLMGGSEQGEFLHRLFVRAWRIFVSTNLLNLQNQKQMSILFLVTTLLIVLLISYYVCFLFRVEWRKTG